MTTTVNIEGAPAPTNEANTNEYGVDHSFSKAQLSKYGRENFDNFLSEIETAYGVVHGELDCRGEMLCGAVMVEFELSIGILMLRMEIEMDKEDWTDAEGSIVEFFWRFSEDVSHYGEDDSLMESLENLVQNNLDLKDIFEQAHDTADKTAKEEVTNDDLLEVVYSQLRLRLARIEAIEGVWERGIAKHKEEVAGKVTESYLNWLKKLRWDMDFPECDEAKMVCPKHLAFVDRLFECPEGVDVDRTFGYLLSRLLFDTNTHEKSKWHVFSDHSLPTVYEKHTACNAYLKKYQAA